MINYPVCVDLTWRHSADLLIGEFCRLRGAVWSSCHCSRRGHVIWSKNVTSASGCDACTSVWTGHDQWLDPLLSSDWWTAARSNYDEWFNNKTFMRGKQTRSVSGVLSLFFPDRPQNKKTLKFVFTLQWPKSLWGVTGIGAFSFPRQSAQHPKLLHKTSYAKWEKLYGMASVVTLFRVLISIY